MSAYAGPGGNNFNSVQGLGGNDTIIGNGNTQVFFNGATAGVTISLAAGHSQSTAASDAAGVGTDTFTGVYSAVGSGFADVYDATGFGVTGAANTGIFGTFNFFEGQGGNDTLIGNGNTQIRFDGATGSVTVDLAAGVADGNATVGHDTFTGVNSAFGSNFGDTILGSSGNEVLNGNGGNDTINGRGGTDTLTAAREMITLCLRQARALVQRLPILPATARLSAIPLSFTALAWQAMALRLLRFQVTNGRSTLALIIITNLSPSTAACTQVTTCS